MDEKKLTELMKNEQFVDELLKIKTNNQDNEKIRNDFHELFLKNNMKLDNDEINILIDSVNDVLENNNVRELSEEHLAAISGGFSPLEIGLAAGAGVATLTAIGLAIKSKVTSNKLKRTENKLKTTENQLKKSEQIINKLLK